MILTQNINLFNYDPGEWNFPIQDIDIVDYNLKEPIQEENVTFPVEDKKRSSSSFHYIRIISNKEKQDSYWLVYSPSKNSVFV
jgi:hypothetical protein